MKYKQHLPNCLTILRMLLAPVAIWLSLEKSNHLYAGIIFVVCCVTDFLDGFLARRWRVTSNFGKTFDPIADKILIIGCLIGLLITKNVIGWVAIALISRDVIMDIIRICLYKKNTIIPAISIAKLKTILQMVGISLIFFIFNSCTCNWLSGTSDTNWLEHIPLLLAVLFGWWSFCLYLRRITKSSRRKK